MTIKLKDGADLPPSTFPLLRKNVCLQHAVVEAGSGLSSEIPSSIVPEF